MEASEEKEVAQIREYPRYLPILGESYEQSLHNARQNPICRVDKIVFNVLLMEEDVMRVSSTRNEI